MSGVGNTRNALAADLVARMLKERKLISSVQESRRRISIECVNNKLDQLMNVSPDVIGDGLTSGRGGKLVSHGCAPCSLLLSHNMGSSTLCEAATVYICLQHTETSSL